MCYPTFVAAQAAILVWALESLIVVEIRSFVTHTQALSGAKVRSRRKFDRFAWRTQLVVMSLCRRMHVSTACATLTRGRINAHTNREPKRALLQMFVGCRCRTDEHLQYGIELFASVAMPLLQANVGPAKLPTQSCQRKAASTKVRTVSVSDRTTKCVQRHTAMCVCLNSERYSERGKQRGRRCKRTKNECRTALK